jgi:DNA repair exonuclease SbcCD ATPase subunit
MTKLPTTFQTLDLQGFEFVNAVLGEVCAQQYTGITREMVDVACAVLQKNRIGIAVRSVNQALKEIYGVGGSTDIVCKLVKEWRTDNLSLIKQGKSEKDLATALLECADDGLVDESEIPEEYLTVSRQMAVASYRLAYQKADTSVSGDRMKSLSLENEVMRQQLKDFPQLQMEIGFYKSEYDRQRLELREAYMNLNKQQLADSEQFRQQLDSLQADRNELQVKLAVAEKRLTEVAELETKERDRQNEISRLSGQLEAREREISSLHSQMQTLQANVGEKQVLEAQLEQVRSQLKESSLTITRLQSQQKSTGSLEVDNLDSETLMAEKEQLEILLSQYKSELEESERMAGDVTSISLENETLHGDLSEALMEIEHLKAELATSKSVTAKTKKLVTSNK